MAATTTNGGERISVPALLLAVVGSVVVNLSLFMLLPYLVQLHNRALSPVVAEPVSLVQVSVPLTQPPRQMAQTRPQLSPQVVKQQLPHLPLKTVLPQPQLHVDLAAEVPNYVGDVVLSPVQLAQLEPVPTVFDSAALDKPLTPLAQSPFIYPLRAKRLGIEGWVRIKLLISKQGTVEQVKILAAVPPNVFEQAVERGVRSWRFSPGTVAGEVVRSWVVTTVRFELE